MIESLVESPEDSPRAILFFGDKDKICHYFKEEYTPAVIFRNWKKIDAKGAKYGPSIWEFTMNPT